MIALQLRSATTSSTYRLMIGLINDEQVEKVRVEFERRVQTGELDVRVVIAKRIPAGVWETVGVDISSLCLDDLYSPDDAFVDVEILIRNQTHTAVSYN